MTEEYNPRQRLLATPAVSSYSVSQSVYNGGRFASGYERALCTVALLVVVAISDFIGGWVCFSRNQSLKAVAAAEMPEESELAASDENFTLVVRANALVSALTAVAFLMWTHRAYRNLPALGNLNPKSNPGLAVGWYFVPVANLLMPYKVMDEIARGSDPTRPADGHKTVPPLVSIWWGSFLLSNLAALVGCFSLSVTNPNVQTLLTSNEIILVAFVLELFAAICAIRLVNFIDAGQTAKNALIFAQRPVGITAPDAILDEFLTGSSE